MMVIPTPAIDQYQIHLDLSIIDGVTFMPGFLWGLASADFEVRFH